MFFINFFFVISHRIQKLKENLLIFEFQTILILKLLRSIVPIFFFFLSLMATAQTEYTRYYDASWKPTTKDSAIYMRKITYGRNGKPKGLVCDYYYDNINDSIVALQWKGYIVSEDLETGRDVLDGKCVWYDKNGKIVKSEFYKDGQKTIPRIPRKLITPGHPDSRLIVISETKNIDHIMVSIDDLKPLAGKENRSVFRCAFLSLLTADGLLEHMPLPIKIIQGADTMCLWGIPSIFLNYHLKNLEFRKGDWFVKTRPWFQQQVVKGKSIPIKRSFRARQRINHCLFIHRYFCIKEWKCFKEKGKCSYIPYKELDFFEIDFANTDDVELISADSCFIENYLKCEWSGVGVEDMKDYLIFDEEAKQYVDKTKNEIDYYGNKRQVPYHAPCYTRTEFDDMEKKESIWAYKRMELKKLQRMHKKNKF